MTQKRIHRLLGALVVLAMPFIGTNLSSADETTPRAGGYPINVPDERLARCLMADIPAWTPGSPIIIDDVIAKTELRCTSLEYGTISDLTGLENLTNLKVVAIDNNHPGALGVTSLEPLRTLWQLEELSLPNHEISDLGPLRELTLLWNLDLASNNVRDLEPLTGTQGLWRLDLRYNDISDLAPLAQLPGLSDVYLQGNHFWSIRPLAGASLQIFAAGDQRMTTVAHPGDVLPVIPEGLTADAPPDLLYLGDHMSFDWATGFTFGTPGIGVTTFSWPQVALDFSEMDFQFEAHVVHPDVPLNSGFAYDIAFLAQTGITTGYADGRFGYGDLVQREQMAAFLYRAAGSPAVDPASCPTFSDVPATSGFAPAICWLSANGITTGYQDGRFGYGDPVLREQMAAFLQRWQAPDYTPLDCQPFPDVPTGSGFANSICWLREMGITTGYQDGRFGYGDPVLREQMAAFIQRTLDPGPF